MGDTILEEWEELKEDFQKLEATKNIYEEKLQEIANYQKECRQGIHHQRYRMGIIKKNLKKSGKDTEELKEKIVKREVQLQEIEQILPKDSDTYLKIILGNVNISILNKEEKLKYKSEYEKFKLVLSAVAFVTAILNLFFVFRLLERLYLFLLVWYYCTLTIRESILRVNGSRIKGWWRLHHFISTAASAILLIWPASETWNLFRVKFMVFNAYLSVVQSLQFRYQSGALYRLKALGERHNMDITIEGFHQWMWRGLSFLFPFLFTVYFFQFYMAWDLYHLSGRPEATWHVIVLSGIFFVLSAGNIITTLMIVPDKFKNKMRLRYRFLSQRLSKKFVQNDGKQKATLTSRKKN